MGEKGSMAGYYLLTHQIIYIYYALVVYYHAHCSISYLACCADMSGIVILCDSEVKKC